MLPAWHGTESLKRFDDVDEAPHLKGRTGLAGFRASGRVGDNRRSDVLVRGHRRGQRVAAVKAVLLNRHYKLVLKLAGSKHECVADSALR